MAEKPASKIREYKGRQYMVLPYGVKSKNSVTAEWEEHVLYTDGHHVYTREQKDFENKFKTVQGG